MMPNKPLLYILTLALLTACHGQITEPRPTIQYVRDIISDKSSPEFLMLSENAFPDQTGDIVVIGPSEQCAAISTQMSISDVFDNFDGARKPDGLADFSGEYVASIIDEPDGGYASFLSDGRSEQLRENTARLVVSAIDSTYSLTAYDLECQGRKSPAKIVVLSDVHQLVYGKFDVDTLLSSTGCGIDVISSFGAMVSRVAPKDGNAAMNIGIIAHRGVTDSTIYKTALSELLPGREVSCYISHVMPADSSDIVLSFLDGYISTGNASPLDAIIVDDYDIAPSLMAEGIRRASSLMSSESLIYGKYLSEGFRFACPAESVASACYAILRNRNIFTHKIALPQTISYKTISRPDEPGILLTPISFYVQD